MSTARDGRQASVTFAALALGASAYTLLQSMVLPALPTLERELDTSQANVSWVLTAYLLSASIATPILGRLGDMYGKKKMLLLLLGALTAGSVLAGLSTSITMLVVARIVQGLAGAIFPIAFGIIRDQFPSRRVPGAIGLMSAMLGIGSGLGVVIAGPVITSLGWRWLFWTPMIISALAMLVAMIFIPESTVRTRGKINYRAALALSGWLISLLLGLSKGASWGWAAPGTLGLFAAAAVLLVVWIQIETRADEPLIDMLMMRIPAVWWTNVAALLLGVGMYATFIVVPPFLQTPSSAGYGFGMSVTASGVFMLTSAVGMLVTSFMIGWISGRFGSKLPMVVGSAMASAPLVALIFLHNERWELLAAMTIQGFGIGLAFSSMSNLVMEAVPPTQTGAATGMNANIRTIGGSIGSQVIASILASGTVAGGYPRERGYSLSFAVMGIAMGAAAIAALAIPRAALGRNRAAVIGPPERADAETGVGVGVGVGVAGATAIVHQPDRTRAPASSPTGVEPPTPDTVPAG